MAKANHGEHGLCYCATCDEHIDAKEIESLRAQVAALIEERGAAMKHWLDVSNDLIRERAEVTRLRAALEEIAHPTYGPGKPLPPVQVAMRELNRTVTKLGSDAAAIAPEGKAKPGAENEVLDENGDPTW